MQHVKQVFVAAVGIGAVNVIDYFTETLGKTVFGYFVVPFIAPYVERVNCEEIEIEIIAKFVFAGYFSFFLGFIKNVSVFLRCFIVP